ncbi:hypothetical protein M2G39_20080 [Vibrio vulnificus]|nr:hypothetical protein [Vibrio vulnificus]MCU8474319.1 hypothetical protein [Vibrio vulnificus]
MIFVVKVVCRNLV